MRDCFLAAVGLAASIGAQAGSWVLLPAVTTPVVSVNVSSFPSMAYDPVRQRSVLFGFAGTGGRAQAETWEYDGVDWALRASIPLSGSATSWSNLIYDEVRQRVMVVIGTLAATTTHEWDGLQWTQVHSAAIPWSQGLRLARDPRRDRSVLVVGTFFNTSWTWDRVTWSSLGSAPAGLGGMAFDPNLCEVVFAADRAMWAFDGVVWRRLEAPGLLFSADLITDPTARRVLANTGSTTWYWDGALWSAFQEVTPRPWALATVFRGLCYDEARGGLLAFTGIPTVSTYVFREHAASFTPFGAGCAGAAGAPCLQAMNSSVPVIGRELVLAVQGLATTSAFTIGVLGFDRTQWNGQPLPFALNALGAPNCQMHLAPVLTTTLPVNSSGQAMWRIPIPRQPLLIDSSFLVQAATIELTAIGFGSLVVSNAGDARIGTR